MKSILYVGATLMIGASIYGFVDYKQTQGKKEFKEMYVEEKEKAPVEIADDKIPGPVVKKPARPGGESAGREKKSVTKKHAVSPKDASPKEEIIAFIKPIAEDEMIDAKETKLIENAPVDIKASQDSGVEKKVIKKKKISSKMFSRGSMEERYIKPKEKVVLSTEEAKATKNKER